MPIIRKASLSKEATYQAPPPIIMGVDPSTKSGVVVLQGDTSLHEEWVNFKDVKGLLRLQLIADRILFVANTFKPERVYIEGLAYGNQFTLVILSQLRVLITDRLDSGGFKWWDIPPLSLKKFTTGSGKAKKPEMWKAVQNRWNVTFKKEDVMEAYALARMGQAHQRGDSSPILNGVKFHEDE